MQDMSVELPSYLCQRSLYDWKFTNQKLPSLWHVIRQFSCIIWMWLFACYAAEMHIWRKILPLYQYRFCILSHILFKINRCWFESIISWFEIWDKFKYWYWYKGRIYYNYYNSKNDYESRWGQSKILEFCWYSQFGMENDGKH